ncbi:unnamed protein product [Phytomonas sp. EM1]|nr:unnamed protein product [Phytomonas sp. EM1]|eukprot:CCW60217.1 unnamed protein product [Phytomonas sp. isolate EM1]
MRESCQTPPADPKPPSLEWQYSTPDNRVPPERGMRPGKVGNPFPGGDFSVECPPSSVPFRSSVASSSSECFSTPQRGRRGSPSPASTHPTLVNNAHVDNDALVENASVVSPLVRSATLAPLQPTRGAVYLNQLLRIPSPDLHLQSPPPLPSSLNEVMHRMGAFKEMDSNTLGMERPTASSSISLELYVPQAIRRQQQTLTAPVGNTDQTNRSDLK